MVIQTNDLSILKNIMIQNQSGTKGIFLTYDDLNDSMKIDFVNHAQNFIGEFSDPAINKNEVLLGTTYNDLTFYFNFNPGSDTVVSSTNGTLSLTAIQGNAIILNYTGNSLSDVITFVLKSKDNTIQKTLKYNLGLTTENALPSGFVDVSITTRNHNYGIVQFSFDKNIDDHSGSVSSLNGVVDVSTITVSDNKMSFNYTTPNQASDVLTFTGLKVATVENTSDVTYQVGGLLEETHFHKFVVIPTSQNYSHTLEAEFTKDISTCSSITATSGIPTTITPTIVDGKVRFSWASGNTANVTFTFNGLTSIDGTIDASVTELEATSTINLYAPPYITGWVSDQPLNPDTFYNLSVQFNQALDSLTPTITSSEAGVTPEFIDIVDNKVNFSVTTGSNPSSAVYSFSDVKALQGGITTNKTISVGPYLTKTEVEMDLEGNFTEYDKLVKGRTQLVKLTLSKALNGTGLSLQNNPNCTFSDVTMINTYTAQFQVTPATTTLDTYLNIETNLLTGADTSQTTSLTKQFNLVESQSIVNLFYSSDKNTAVSNFDVGTPVALSLQVSKPINDDLTDTTVVSSDGTHGDLSISTSSGKYYYNFNFTPITIGTEQWIKIQQAKDYDNFIYNLTKSGLTFSAVIPVIGGLWDPSIASTLTLSTNNITEFRSSNSTNKYIDYKNDYFNNSAINTDYVKYVVSSPSYLSFEHLTSTTNAGFYYKKNPSASYTEYTFTIVFQEPSILVAQTYADLPSIGWVGGTTNYQTYHPPSGYTMNSGVSRVAGQKRVLTLSIKSSVTSGHGSGNQYIKVDNNTAVSVTTMLYDNGYNGFFLGCNTGGASSFKGRIYYVQLLPNQLTDTQVSTLHTNLRSTYGF